MKFKLEGKHHPYCLETYKVYDSRKDWTMSWRCICDTLKGYDVWLAEQEQKGADHAGD